MSVAIGVDVGGTFTDFFVLDLERNRSWVHKTPSTPVNPAEAIRTGLQEILMAGGVAAAAVFPIPDRPAGASEPRIQRRGGRGGLVVAGGVPGPLRDGCPTRS